MHSHAVSVDKNHSILAIARVNHPFYVQYTVKPQTEGLTSVLPYVLALSTT
jgi:hypothetical protein